MGAITLQGRELSDGDIQQICRLRMEYPHWTRRQLSEHLAKQWRWRNEAGRLKDMAARTLLLKLQARGLIDLPPPRNSNGNRQRLARLAELSQQLELPGQHPDAVSGPLKLIQPVVLELAETLGQRRGVTELLRKHHYRGYGGAVGENVQYLARDRHGRELAVMVFGAAAWRIASRDTFIGWSVSQRQARLGWVVNQQRFLILPWVRVAHLASHLLAVAVQRLCADWQRRYGHPVWLVESFVEGQRFSATCYKAAGWIQVGETTGRTRQDRQHNLQTPIKSVWLKALHPAFRNHLTMP